MKKKQSGVTLQELITVVAIISILSVTAYSFFIYGRRLISLQNYSILAENEALEGSLVMSRELREAQSPEGTSYSAIYEAKADSIIFHADVTDEGENNMPERIQYLLTGENISRGVAYWNHDTEDYDALPPLSEMRPVEPRPSGFVKRLLPEKAYAQTEEQITGGTVTTTGTGDPQSVIDGTPSTGITLGADEEVVWDFGGTYTQIVRLKIYSSTGSPFGINVCFYPWGSPALRCDYSPSSPYYNWRHTSATSGPPQAGWNDYSLTPFDGSKIRIHFGGSGSIAINELQAFYTGDPPSNGNGGGNGNGNGGGGSSSNVICQYVRNSNILYYYDSNYTGSEDPLEPGGGGLINVGLISVIRIHLEIDVNLERDPDNFIHDTTVKPRNLGT